MRKTLFLLLVILLQAAMNVSAQSGPPAGEAPQGAPAMDQLTSDLDMRHVQSAIMVSINKMDQNKIDKLNRTASSYRSSTRGVGQDIANAMLQGGITGIVNVVSNEIINLMQIRSKQKREWNEMRQRECLFVDSLQSVAGQSDFYGRQSSYGPMDPSDMQFDGITLNAVQGGQEVFSMVCHIDTTRLDHMFLHSKFYLIIDSLAFNPYKSFLPNMGANRITRAQTDEMTRDERDYWETISHFNFGEQQSPTLNVQIDIYSSWINDLTEVFDNVRLGSFTMELPIRENELTDSMYIYSRREALAKRKPTIDLSGDCFVIPRSYMPVSYDRPSWGTGEYKMKIIFTERCRYNPDGHRAQNWRRDYKQLKKMQNHGKEENAYLNELITTFRDNRFAILKATYLPALTKGASYVKFGQSTGMPAAGGAAGGMGGASGAGGGGNMGGGTGGMDKKP